MPPFLSKKGLSHSQRQALGLTLCTYSLPCLILLIHCYVLIIFLNNLTNFFLLRFVCPCSLWHCQAYLLSFIWESQRPQEWRHASVTHGSVSSPTGSWFDCSCPWFLPADQYELYHRKGKNRRMHYFTVTWYLCVFVFMKSKQDMKRRSLCTGCSKQVSVIFLGLSVLLSLGGEQGSPPSSLHCPSCHGWQALPPLPESAPTQPSIPPAASRQNSLVIPSLAPDKTPARLGHNLRPPDRPACNTNIFHKGGRRWRQMFHILDEALDVLPPCPPSLYSRCPDIWAHSLVCECVFFFLILEPPPHPCGRCIAQAGLWLSPCLCTGCTYCMYTEVVLREWWLATLRLSGVWELATASALQIWSPMAVKSFTMWKPFN